MNLGVILIKRTQLISFRCSEEEKTQIRLNARGFGLDAGTYCRTVALIKPEPLKIKIPEQEVQNAKKTKKNK